MGNEPFASLASAVDPTLAELLERELAKATEHYSLSEWREVGVCCGHFYECARRIIEKTLFGTFTALDKSLPALNDQQMNTYAHASGDVGLRLHIPRAILFISGLRNKRGFGHLSEEQASKHDAYAMLTCARWITGEFSRVFSTKGADVDFLLRPPIPYIWSDGTIIRVLGTGTLKQKISICLVQAGNWTVANIADACDVEARYITRALKAMHKEQLVHFKADGSQATLLPKGQIFAAEAVKTT